MIEDFSSGYYRTVMTVQEYENGPAIERGLYDFINRILYVDSTMPVTIRLGLDADELFDVQPENAIPRDVLALPSEFFDGRGKTDVFILKSEYADTIGGNYV